VRFLGKAARIRLQACDVARESGFPSGENQRACHKLRLQRVARSRASPRGSSSSAPHSDARHDLPAGPRSARGRTQIVTGTGITVRTRSSRCAIDGRRAPRRGADLTESSFRADLMPTDGAAVCQAQGRAQATRWTGGSHVLRTSLRTSASALQDEQRAWCGAPRARTAALRAPCVGRLRGRSRSPW